MDDLWMIIAFMFHLFQMMIIGAKRRERGKDLIITSNHYPSNPHSILSTSKKSIGRETDAIPINSR